MTNICKISVEALLLIAGTLISMCRLRVKHRHEIFIPRNCFIYCNIFTTHIVDHNENKRIMNQISITFNL